MPSARTPLFPVALLATLLLIALGGCGSSSSPGANADPAKVTPAAAPLYLSAVVQPTGTLKTDALADASKFTGSANPFGGLLKLLQGPGAAPVSFEHHVKPWLGSRAGLFLSSLDLSSPSSPFVQALERELSEGLAGAGTGELGLGSIGLASLRELLGKGGAQGAIVLDTTNPDAARSFLSHEASAQGSHQASYRGVAYEVGADGVAAGIVGDYAVLGSEAGLHSVIDTEQGGAAITGAAGYSQLVATAEAGALANLYVNPGVLLGATKAPSKAAQFLPLLRGLLGGTGQSYLSLIPQASAFTVDLDTLPGQSSAGEASLIPGAASAQIVGGLPSSSWLAAGVGDLGGSIGEGGGALRSLFALAGGLKLGSFSLGGAFTPLASPKFDLQRNLLSWAGPAAIFASGSGLLNLQAGLVIAAKDAAKARAGLESLAGLYREAGGQVAPTSIPGAESAATIKLKDFPVVIAMGVGAGKFAIGIGPTSVQEALSPTSTLAEAAAYKSAAATLGHGIQPSLLVEFPTMLALIEALGLSQAEGVSAFATRLKPLGTLVGGGGQTLSGGVKRARAVLSLQQ